MIRTVLRWTSAALAAAAVASGVVAASLAWAPGHEVTVVVDPGVPYGITQEAVDDALRDRPALASRELTVRIAPGPMPTTETSGRAALGADVLIRINAQQEPYVQGGPNPYPPSLAEAQLGEPGTTRTPSQRDSRYTIERSVRSGLELGQNVSAVQAGIHTAAGELASPAAVTAPWLVGGGALLLAAAAAWGFSMSTGRGPGAAGDSSARRLRESAAALNAVSSGQPQEEARQQPTQAVGDTSDAVRQSLLDDARLAVAAAQRAPRLADTRAALLDAALRRAQTVRLLMDPAAEGAGLPQAADAARGVATELLLGLQGAPVELISEASVVGLRQAVAQPINSAKRADALRAALLASRAELTSIALATKESVSSPPAAPKAAGKNAFEERDLRPLLTLAADVELLSRRLLASPSFSDAEIVAAQIPVRKQTPGAAAARKRAESANSAKGLLMLCGLVVGATVGSWIGGAAQTKPPAPRASVTAVGFASDNFGLTSQRVDGRFESVELPAPARVLVVDAKLSSAGERLLATARATAENKYLRDRVQLPLADMQAPLEKAKREFPEAFTPAGEPRMDTVIVGVQRAADGSLGTVSVSSGFFASLGSNPSVPKVGSESSFERPDDAVFDWSTAVDSVGRNTSASPDYQPERPGHPVVGSVLGALVGLNSVAWLSWLVGRRRNRTKAETPATSRSGSRRPRNSRSLPRKNSRARSSSGADFDAGFGNDGGHHGGDHSGGGSDSGGGAGDSGGGDGGGGGGGD